MVNSYRPSSLKEALDVLAKEEVTPYAGGTDLMIKADENARYLFLNKISEMKNILEDEKYIHIGAGCTFTDIIENELTPAILKEAVSQIAAPAIRNLGTVGGNICNGSPKADSALIFFVTDSKLRIVSSKEERIIPINEFYLGRKKTSLKKDELLVEVLMNKEGFDNYYYKKVGARNALAISRVSFAGILNVENNKICNCSTAFGAVKDVIIRLPVIDRMLIGKTIEEAKTVKKEYLAAYDKVIIPIKGRVSAEYRKIVCMNLLRDFLESNGI
ncbi:MULTISPECIES: FAD binding domain-containing protein [Clostridium]|uniref:Nicotinate dehydrogenase FAD-subunit n=3 Tax=Clostridium TaxID=1485 RepID=D8GL87_CLOLD|nr:MULTISPECIES: FAD binding domain-containing protein [Clostridium]ADK15446.1 putative xanthine dehydrogenase subunit, FAD-binding domain [Clostridium ljungdahlii DSM 13528]AGY74683.1 FAD binding domain-containing protein [Clostridium autoethanogenum DSM 10061]ALU34864.1 Molybdopterin-family oxidoreductase FAD-binding subunit [Clostridium autoethanogenum DSM 10061]OAA88548.1 Nicotinate dehydrogenase FAD-subunit [Clostridium ljungdahlii DSM 13528]OVY51585.1 Nicotinate dehydrogenase FAD-subunit